MDPDMINWMILRIHVEKKLNQIDATEAAQF